MNLNDFKPLISILELCPEDTPMPTVDWQKDDQDLEIEWYFRDGNYVQLCLGENFKQGVIFFRCGDESGRIPYTPELLIEYLEKLSINKQAEETLQLILGC
jgi:hypothetical protein